MSPRHNLYATPILLPPPHHMACILPLHISNRATLGVQVEQLRGTLFEIAPHYTTTTPMHMTCACHTAPHYGTHCRMKAIEQWLAVERRTRGLEEECWAHERNQRDAHLLQKWAAMGASAPLFDPLHMDAACVCNARLVQNYTGWRGQSNAPQGSCHTTSSHACPRALHHSWPCLVQQHVVGVTDGQ